jgi:hypothetical protein
MHMICTIILLTTSLCPFVWGLKVIVLVNLVSIRDHILDQKALRNLLSLSEMMVCGGLK